jgi:uncharacterized membrane protein YgdD (TMEM256/DUF423 family)
MNEKQISNAERRLWIWGAMIIGTAVVLGAFGAHAVKQHVDEISLGWWHTAADYQRVHGLGILALAALWPRVQAVTQTKLILIARCFVVGVLLFSGSLYTMTLTQMRFLGAITPVGGSLWILGWGLLIFALLKESSNA